VEATGSPEVMFYLHDAPAQIRQFPEVQKMVDQLKALKPFGAQYCQDPKTGEIKGAFTKQSLDERLRDAATRNPEALPLLQFYLEALHQAQAKRVTNCLLTPITRRRES
jgi:hypothetical protein